MKKYFYSGLTGLLLFEFLRVYLIMPMPGSQEADTLPLAYFLHSYRWLFRSLFIILCIAGFKQTLTAKRKWIPVTLIVLVLAAVWLFNFPMSADSMFLQPASLSFEKAQGSSAPDEMQCITVTLNGESKAYPVSYIIYHHQVRDHVGGQAVMVTYCSVCRTGRVYKPIVNGKEENFRLVGMDHFNAMFEDERTGSWWRQATGEAVAGELKGQQLQELPCDQQTLATWKTRYPQGMLMKADVSSAENYDVKLNYESGRSKSSLTGTDPVSGNKKSWVIGVINNGSSCAYDWNILKNKRIIADTLGKETIAIVLHSDEKSFSCFRIPVQSNVVWKNDSISVNGITYDFSGTAADHSGRLPKINAYQEFHHSWLTFHPDTRMYQ